MTTAERLIQFYDFDEAVLAAVQETAARQNSQHYTELADEHGIGDGPQQIRPFTESRRVLEYATLTPPGDYDETKCRLLFTPMGIGVDESMMMRAMRLFDAQPDERLMVVGSPAAIGNKTNLLRIGDLPAVAAGNLSVAVEPALHYLHKRRVTTIDTLGYSYGADAAAAAAGEAARFALEVRHGVWAETASATSRSVGRLALDFVRSGDELDNYVNAADSMPLREARDLADTGFPRWIGGMVLRGSNLAIARGLARGGFAHRARTAYDTQPGLHTAIAWGTASELTDSGRMEQIVSHLQTLYDTERTKALPLTGMHHAGGDDIDLHAAIMLQGLRPAPQSTPDV